MAKISNFEKDYIGLTNTEVNENSEMFGRNSFSSAMSKYNLNTLLKSLLRPVNAVLMLCAIVCLFFGQWLSLFISLIILIIYIAVDFLINRKITNDVQSFHDKAVRKVNTVRNGQMTEIPADKLLPGDIIYLKEGEIVPADCAVLEEYELTVDEAILSGISVAVIKTADTDNSGNKLKSNYIYCGSTINSGEVVAKIFATGKRTMCARNDLVAISAPLRPSQSERIIKDFSSKLELISILPFLICFFILYVVKASANIYNPVIFSTALSLSLVPAFIPVMISTISYLNVRSFNRKNRHIINYYATDDAGNTDIICVDKTGIITSNKLSIAEIYTENKQAFVHISTLACDKNNPSALDNIILEFCEEVGADVPIIQSNYLVHTFPFSSAEKMSAFVWKINGDTILCAKGSPEDILRICNLSESEKAVIASKQEEFSKKGYSVIAVAYKDLQKGDLMASAISKENGLNFAGLFAINDPPRDSITYAVENCKANDINLIMITGDNQDTALSIATNIGLDTSGGIVTGEDVDNCPDDELNELILKTKVFARVSPDTKLKIVNTLKSTGKRICVVGDSKDDVAVLQSATVGISLGEEPSEYAKEASDIWIKNNSLDEITDTVVSCKKNRFAINKAINYAFDMQIVMFVTNLLALLFSSKSSNVQPAFMSLTVLFIQSIVFVLSVLVYSNYKEKLQSQHSKPISIIINIVRLLSTIFVTFLSYTLFLNSAHLDNISTNIDIAFGSARCFAFITFAFTVGISAFNYYSDDLFTVVSFIKKLRNPKIVIVLMLSLVSLILIAFVPSINEMFGLHSISILFFLLAFALALIPTIISDLLKTLKR